MVWEISDSFKAKHSNVYTDKALKEIVEKGNETDLRELISKLKKSVVMSLSWRKTKIMFQMLLTFKKNERNWFFRSAVNIEKNI